MIPLSKQEAASEMWLTQYLAHAGVCARRKASLLVAQGAITINGVKIIHPAHQVYPDDHVRYHGRRLAINPYRVLLLNKPKGYITTLHDPQGRKSVCDLLPKTAHLARMVPVGRLDRNTTGLLLFTNNGPLANRLMHPRHQVPKRYHVTLHNPIPSTTLATLQNGVTLEDGFVKPDKVDYHNNTANQLIITLHSGRNRIVRRLFAHLGHPLKDLERIAYAHLTKGQLKPGSWRYLHHHEIAPLQQL